MSCNIPEQQEKTQCIKIAYRTEFVGTGLTPNAILVLSDIWHWSNRMKKTGGWFYRSNDEWKDLVGLKRHALENARNLLIKHNLIEVTKKRVPCTFHYKMKFPEAVEFLAEFGRVPEDDISYWLKPTVQNVGIEQTITENITEIKTDIINSNKLELNNKPKPKRKNITDCPHDEILALYHDILPELSEVIVFTERRKKYLNARWRDNKEHRNLEFWSDYFRYIRELDWLMGRVKHPDGKSRFKADFEWLIEPNNFAKVI